MVGRFTVSISPISRTAWAPWAPLTQVGTCAPSLVQPSRSSRRYQPESSGSTRRGCHRSRSPASCKPKPRPTRGPPEEEGLRTTLGSSPQPFPHTPSPLPYSNCMLRGVPPPGPRPETPPTGSRDTIGRAGSETVVAREREREQDCRTAPISKAPRARKHSYKGEATS